MAQLTPEQTQQLVDQGLLAPETASRMQPPVQDPFNQPMDAVQPEPVGLEDPAAPQAEQPPPQPKLYLDPTKFGQNAPMSPAAAAQPVPPVLQPTAPALPVEAKPEVTPEELVDYQASNEPLPSSERIYGDATAGIDMQQEAITKAAEAGAAMGAEKAAKENKMLEEDLKQQKKLRELEIERQAKVTEGFQDLDSKLEDLQGEQIDPDRYWNNASTGSKILASIGLALGALGGDNTASLNMINNAINRDIDAQKADLANKRSAIASQRGVLKDMQAHYKDLGQAENATRLAYLNNTQAKIENMMTKYKNTQLKAKAQQMIGALEQQKLAIRGQMAQKFAEAQPVAPNSKPEEMTPEQRKRFIPGMGVAQYGLDEEIKQLRTRMTQRFSAKENVQELLTILEKPYKSLSLVERERANTLSSLLQGQMRTEIVGPGAVTDAERKLIESIIKNPAKFFSFDKTNRAALKELISVMDRSTAVEARMYGLTTQAQRLDLKDAK